MHRVESEAVPFEKPDIKDNDSDSDVRSNSTDCRDSITTSSQKGSILTSIESACSITDSPRSEKTEWQSVSS